MIGRRDLLSWMAGTFALTACTRAPKEEIVPYVQRSPEVTPGKARYYATAATLDGYAIGTLVESHEGRPTKVEGNPDHPASLGATSVFEQAAIYSLYDPKRARGEAWEKVVAAVRGAKNVQLVLEPTSSPTAAALITKIRVERPDIGIWFHSTATPKNAWEGARIAFGRVLEPRYDLTKADVIVALDADFLDRGPQRLRLARQFADRRVSADMNRLYAIGPLVNVTSSNADHRIPARAADVIAHALSLAAALGLPTSGDLRAEVIARDLQAHRGRSLVIVGDDQPPIVHALAHAINSKLGNIGQTVTFGPSVIIDAGEKSHALPTGGELTIACTAVPESIHALRPALAHELESWGDARAFDGTVSVIQPLISPLHDGRTPLDVLSLFAGGQSAYDLVKNGYPDDRAWRRALKRGIVDGTATPTVDVSVDAVGIAKQARFQYVGGPGIELVTPLDPRMHDGRFIENAWLLELPQSVTTLTWTNAALMSPALAAKLGVTTGDEVILKNGGELAVPVLVVAGQADDTVGLTRGWGHGPGFDASIVTAGPGLSVTKTGKKIELPLTQLHHRLEGRDEEIAQHRTLTEERTRHVEPRKRQLTLYSPQVHDGPKWGMAIDLSRCIGCDACMIACQAENNIPVVGAEQVMRGRVMHWLRMDTYVTEGEDYVAQPMLCQHCEKAPCEYVCPVGATTHSPEGINEMTYNRCVGTRFCSNNCPYKVRRFNWFDWHHGETSTEELAHNPDVTVRERGVMEKCTFCVQRIREHEPETPKTACQQACPAGAIVFGNVADGRSEVARLHDDRRSFAALAEIGTEPRVRYLAKIRNPNPELA